MKVLKFGGSSVAKPERIKGIVEILKKYVKAGEAFTVVFSAFGGVTDSLIDVAKKAENSDVNYLVEFEKLKARHIESAKLLTSGENLKTLLKYIDQNNDDLLNVLKGIYLIREVSARTLDYVVSFGERFSNKIVAHTLVENGIKAEYLDARYVIKTDRNFGSARVDFEETESLIAEYYAHHSDAIQIVTGFIGSVSKSGKNNDFGLTTTLGRGGSDYTAAILAAGLNASVIEIWTDVDGVLTADPRKVKKAFTIPTMTYAEAMEMSHFGAKVIYPPTLVPALKKKIPLYIKNTFNPDFVGTYISTERNETEHAIQGISSIGNISLLTLSGSGLFGVPGIAGRLFSALAHDAVNIILITQGSSESSISFAVQPTDTKRAKHAVEKAFANEMKNNAVNALFIEENLATIAIVGEAMRFRPGIAGTLFDALGKNGINCVAIAQGSSELNISVIVPRTDETKALNALHEAFFLSDTLTLNVFLVGVGLIGSELLKQMAQHAHFLKTERAIELKLVGVANSRHSVFDINGIDFTQNIKTVLSEGEATSPEKFIKKMIETNASNAVFIDCTASADVAQHYNEVLAQSISIVTPNKIANTGNLAQYKILRNTARKTGVKFLYETNVGAGLPVINTLKDLLNSGDRIIKIEGVLSGSLSFIFNNFDSTKKFSDVVKKAGELGFTEPDPRLDLNGSDVRRKLLILARECGFGLEMTDISVENFLPQVCLDAPTVPEFFAALKNNDSFFTALIQKADAENKKLRYVATIENGKCNVGLQSFDTAHPFYLLSGSDNMIVFNTERYSARPLVVRGPGAGAAVTAAGVFAEVISIANYLM